MSDTEYLRDKWRREQSQGGVWGTYVQKMKDMEAELNRLREKERLFEQLEYRMTQENARLRKAVEVYERYVNGELTVTGLRDALKETT